METAIVILAWIFCITCGIGLLAGVIGAIIAMLGFIKEMIEEWW